MLARLASCCVACVSLAVIFAPRLCAQAPKTAEKTKGDFAGTKAGEEWDGNGLKMKFCWCPPGRFKMGSPANEEGRREAEKQVSVTISQGFWMGKYEVTQREFGKLNSAHKSSFSAGGNDADRVPAKNTEFLPVDSVTWNEAMDFCATMTSRERRDGRLPRTWAYSLPTEAQWEYACRAGTTTAFHFGNDEKDLGEYDWFHLNAHSRPHQVGEKKPNRWGLYDMHGNVSEWCRDWYRPDVPGGTDPVVLQLKRRASALRSARGGGWFSTGTSCRSAHRWRCSPEDRSSDIGFRLAIVRPLD